MVPLFRHQSPDLAVVPEPQVKGVYGNDRPSNGVVQDADEAAGARRLSFGRGSTDLDSLTAAGGCTPAAPAGPIPPHTPTPEANIRLAPDSQEVFNVIAAVDQVAETEKHPEAAYEQGHDEDENAMTPAVATAPCADLRVQPSQMETIAKRQSSVSRPVSDMFAEAAGKEGAPLVMQAGTGTPVTATTRHCLRPADATRDTKPADLTADTARADPTVDAAADQAAADPEVVLAAETAPEPSAAATAIEPTDSCAEVQAVGQESHTPPHKAMHTVAGRQNQPPAHGGAVRTAPDDVSRPRSAAAPLEAMWESLQAHGVASGVLAGVAPEPCSRASILEPAPQLEELWAAGAGVNLPSATDAASQPPPCTLDQQILDDTVALGWDERVGGSGVESSQTGGTGVSGEGLVGRWRARWGPAPPRCWPEESAGTAAEACVRAAHVLRERPTRRLAEVTAVQALRGGDWLQDEETGFVFLWSATLRHPQLYGHLVTTEGRTKARAMPPLSGFVCPRVLRVLR